MHRYGRQRHPLLKIQCCSKYLFKLSFPIPKVWQNLKVFQKTISSNENLLFLKRILPNENIFFQLYETTWRNNVEYYRISAIWKFNLARFQTSSSWCNGKIFLFCDKNHWNISNRYIQCIKGVVFLPFLAYFWQCCFGDFDSLWKTRNGSPKKNNQQPTFVKDMSNINVAKHFFVSTISPHVPTLLWYWTRYVITYFNIQYVLYFHSHFESENSEYYRKNTKLFLILY